MGFNNGKEVTERKKERKTETTEDVENSSLSLHCHILYIRIQFIQHICLIKYKNQVLLLVQTIRNGFIFQCQTEIFEKNKQIRLDLTSQPILNTVLFSKWKVTLIYEAHLGPGTKLLARYISYLQYIHFLELSRDGYEKLWGSQQVFCKPDKLSSVVSMLCFYKECNKNIPRPRLTVNHVNNHRGGVAAAGGAGVVTGVLVSRLGHYQSTLCPLVSCQN